MKVPRRILMAIPLRIGDVLLTTPVIRSMRQAWPEAEIDVLVFENTEGILQHNPDINRIITVPARPRFWAHLKLVASIFRRYDLALTTQLGDRPTLYVWFAGKFRLGMQDGSKKARWKQHLLDRWAYFDHKNTHTVLTNLGLVDLLGIQRNHEVVAAWNAQDETVVAQHLPFELGKERYAVLHITPKFPYKMWNNLGWIELAQWLKTRGIRVVLSGSGATDELAYVSKIFAAMPEGTVNLAGKLTLAEDTSLIGHACCYVGPDTSMTHAAAALGVPTVALFGPSNPVKWGPWPKGYQDDRNPYAAKGTQRVGNVVIMQGSGDCVPCMKEGCDQHNLSLSACLQNLPTSQVIGALEDLLGRAPPIFLKVVKSKS